MAAPGNRTRGGKTPESDFETFVRTTLSSLSTKVDDIITSQSALDTRISILETNTKCIKDITESLNFQDTRIKTNETDIASIKTTVIDNTSEIEALKTAVYKLQAENNNLERYTRSFNLRFLNVAEVNDENCRDTLNSLLQQHLGTSGDAIENCHRTGAKKTGTPRHIIARFHSRVERTKVIRSARNADPRLPFIVMDDLTPVDLTEKRRVGPVMKRLYEDGKRPSFRAGRLFVDGRVLPKEVINSTLETLAADAAATAAAAVNGEE